MECCCASQVIGRLTEGYYMESLRVNGQKTSTCMRAEMESAKGGQTRSILFNIQTEATTDQVSKYLY